MNNNSLSKILFHIDMDAYFAACEIASRPYLKGKPLVVTNHYRHIVLTASYEARAFGIKTGMPLYRAQQLCKTLKIVFADPDKYISTTGSIHELLLTITDRFEPLSIDEVIMDVTQVSSNYCDAAKLAYKIKFEVKKQIGVTCSIGISPSRSISKYASGVNKPDGLHVISKNNFWNELKNIPASEIAGIGSSTKLLLKSVGVYTCIDLHKCRIEILLKLFGQNAFHLKSLILNDAVKTFYDREAAKSISSSHTLIKDTDNIEILTSFLEFLVWKVSDKLKMEGLTATEVSLSIRYEDFTHSNHSTTLKEPVNSTSMLYNIGKAILSFYLPLKKKVRLLCFRVKCIEPRYKQLTFLNMQKSSRFEVACQKINRKYGNFTVKPAMVMLFEAFGKPEKVIPPVFTDIYGKTYRATR